jgi:2-polyprenyl-3-methyl-5-hydroxy-6-metoxy-1,4-benzoquinol methylase
MNIYYKKKIDQLFKKLNQTVQDKPYLVVIVLHELYRSVYDVDNYISYKIKDPKKRLNFILEHSMKILRDFEKFGNYKVPYIRKKNENLIDKTGNVYGKLWNKMSIKSLTDGAYQILKRRFKNIKNKEFKQKNFFSNKVVLDTGCGSGRYSNALLRFGAKKVIGIDGGKLGISLAKKNYKNKKLNFKQENILNTSIKSSKFDFVFCNGVLHHTSDLYRGLKEILRICKPNGFIWLYLYGTGGSFWYLRKLMNNFMKKIPEDYTQNVLEILNMPMERFIFMDNWYVPIEKHSKHVDIISFLKKHNVQSIEKVMSGDSTDLENAINNNKKHARPMWGEGDIRLFIKR